ncbi:MAG: hypothetical protein JWN95_2554 [Frankiales bacterium]|nr:hypothetical protein [Frankiales bacterium]
MPAPTELRTLNRAIDDLRSAVTSLNGRYGEVPVVARLRNDLERLIIDVNEVQALPPGGPAGGATLVMTDITDEPYDRAMWSEDADDEGLGGFRGTSR